MKLIEGKLRRLGAASVNGSIVKYSLIQVDDQVFPDVEVGRKLNNFLEDGLRTEAPTKLWFLGNHKTLMAVQVGDNTRYLARANPAMYVMLVVFVLAAVAGASYHWAWPLFVGIV